MGLLDGAIAPTIDTYEYSPTNATSTGYDSTQQTNAPTTTANTYQAQDATANTYDATNQNAAVTYDATKVSDSLTGLLSEDSSYMQNARSKALQGMNQRGLSNSSMAIGAGQTAAIQAGLPIAQGDANAMNTAAGFNAQAGNAVNSANAGFQNQADSNNANAMNQIALSNQQAQNRSLLDNANAANSSDQFNASIQNQVNTLNQGAENDAAKYNATAANEFNLQNKKAIDQASKDFASANNDASLQNAENNMRILLANAQESLTNYSTDIQRKTALDGIASTLIQSGLTNGIFATSDGAANWIQMIGDLYPDMGLSVTTALTTDASSSVV